MPCTRRYFDQAYYDGLSDEDKETFYKCIKTGFDNADSGMGCYAMTPTDYTTFAPFFAKAIGDYHKGDPACAEKHENDWDIRASARAASSTSRSSASPRSCPCASASAGTWRPSRSRAP